MCAPRALARSISSITKNHEPSASTKPSRSLEKGREARVGSLFQLVDIHRKPGYDPVELFLDPKIPLPKLKIAWRLLQKKLGLRMLMDLIPLDATLVKGSHGRRPADKKDWPVC